MQGVINEHILHVSVKTHYCFEDRVCLFKTKSKPVSKTDFAFRSESDKCTLS